MYGFSYLALLFIFNFENSMPETLTDLLYNAWLGTTGMCFSVG